jgi:hypothetical protein
MSIRDPDDELKARRDLQEDKRASGRRRLRVRALRWIRIHGRTRYIQLQRDGNSAAMSDEVRFRVTYYVPSAPSGQRTQIAWFWKREAALAFFETSNLACLFDGKEKLAESLRIEQ